MRLALLAVVLLGCSVESVEAEPLGTATAALPPEPTSPPPVSTVQHLPIYNATASVNSNGPWSIEADCVQGDTIDAGSGVCTGPNVSGSAVHANGWQCSGSGALGQTIKVSATCAHVAP